MISLRKWIIGALILAIIAGLYWRFSSRTHVLGEAYVSDQSVVLWNTLAQVRMRAGEAHWGDQVEILKRSSADTMVRTPAGIEGWVDGHSLIDSAAWQREVKLQSSAHAMPIQATGHTKVFSNIRLDAGRDATRIYQLTGGVPVAIVAHVAVELPPAPPVSGSGTAPPVNAKKGEGSKREDWVLVYPLPAGRKSTPPGTPSQSAAGAPPRGPVGLQPSPDGAQAPPNPAPETAPGPSPDNGSAQAREGDLVMGRASSQPQPGAPGAQYLPPLAGWVLARFVELDLPETLRDYATSAGMRPVAWFVLNYVSDQDDVGGKPQYLMAGNHNVGEGESCDFNSLRVYTWGEKRHRYETAYVEGNFCGYFPIRAGKQARTGDPEFRFTALETGGAREERVYAMHQTSVRRLREAESTKSSAPPKSAKRR